MLLLFRFNVSFMLLKGCPIWSRRLIVSVNILIPSSIFIGSIDLCMILGTDYRVRLLMMFTRVLARRFIRLLFLVMRRFVGSPIFRVAGIVYDMKRPGAQTYISFGRENYSS